MQGKLDGQVGLNFLLLEIKSGFTFLDLARVEDPHETVVIARNIQNARKAYETVQRLRDRVELSQQENERIDEGLRKLDEALRAVEQPRRR
jgi:hypothetical protein